MDNKELKYYPNCDSSIWLRSCKKEITEPIKGTISGIIPLWLNGVLIRNGPGSLEVGKETFKHLFDCSALLHRFAVKDGHVTYQCRFLQSETFKKNKKANRIAVTEFGTKSMPDPCCSIFQRISAVFKSKDNESDNALVSVYPFSDELYALTETPVIYKINQNNLETEKKVDVSKNVAIVNHTAHPHIDKDGSVYNLAMSVTKSGPCHNIVCFPSKPKNCSDDYSMFEKAHIVATIPARWPFHPSYMHSFGITENYFIIVEQPMSLSLPSLLINKVINEPIAGSFRWYSDEMTQINIISRKTGKLTHKFYSGAFFYMHIINQYETSDYIFLDICSYKDPSLLNYLYIEALKNIHDYTNMFRSQPIRFILPLNARYKKANKQEKAGCNLVNISNTEAEACFLSDGNIFVKPEQLYDLGCEMPTIHYENHSGRKYRFFYAINADVDAETPGMIIKVDTKTKTSLKWCESNCYFSEPIFVPIPNPETEDDGVVLAAMIWGGEDTNHVGLIILDAKTFTEVGRAEFRTPSPVPKCLHGWFLHHQTC